MVHYLDPLEKHNFRTLISPTLQESADSMAEAMKLVRQKTDKFTVQYDSMSCCYGSEACVKFRTVPHKDSRKRNC